MIDVETWISIGVATFLVGVLLTQVAVGCAIPFNPRGIVFLDNWRDLVVWKDAEPDTFWLTIAGQGVAMFIFWSFTWIMV